MSTSRFLARLYSDVFGRRLYVLFVLALLIKVLWGYWGRDLTFGDTSSYFRDATTWANSREVNIVWSPLYTAYFGTWWWALGDAVSATFMHRLSLILVSSGMVAWLAWRTLPRILAFLMVAWWVVLPIHYDTLYEVHLFGSLPLIFMVSILGANLPLRWRFPVWLFFALTTFLLVRNEYIIIFIVLCLMVGWSLVTGNELRAQGGAWGCVGRYGLCLVVPLLLAAAAYQLSYVKGGDVAKASAPKHTLNMCQVYAFGHQQRHPDWKFSPWTQCQDLMKEHFGKGEPALSEMIFANPVAVAKHFVWNLSLLPAGLELLFFNVVGGKHNPDYASVLYIPLYPRFALLGMALVAGFFTWRVFFRSAPEGRAARDALRSGLPLIFGSVLMLIAIVLTQRPRPSYLLGFGVLAVWYFGVLTSAAWPQLRKLDVGPWPLALAVILVFLAPSYAALSLPGKNGMLKELYRLANPHRDLLCRSGGKFALSEYPFELSSYLCSPIRDLPREGGVATLALGSLSSADLSDPLALVAVFKSREVKALVIDPPFFDKNPAMASCAVLRKELLSNDWKILAFRETDERRCFAAFVWEPRRSDLKNELTGY
jgi:hypothetical protein